MSAPDYMTIRMVPENYELGEVFLDKWGGAHYLYEYLAPHIARLAPDYYIDFKNHYIGGDILGIYDMPAQYFRAVYDLILSACDEIEVLKNRKDEFKQKMEADPRFKQAD